jgi:hypothetical protein
LVVFSLCFRDIAFRDLMGEIHVNPSWFFLSRTALGVPLNNGEILT